MQNLTDNRYGRFIVLGFAFTKHYKSERNQQTKSFWNCRCDCGAEKTVCGEHLTSGRIQSCGCLGSERSAARLRTHGASFSPEHRSWISMNGRVRSNDAHKKEYYAHVSIDATWLGPEGFAHFLSDMGPKPTPKHELDRIDPNGNYGPANCQWATRTEQMFNQRRNRDLRLHFESLEPVVAWSTFRQRVCVQGWSPEKAARTPKMKNQHG